MEVKGEKVMKLDPRAVNLITRYKNLDNKSFDVEFDWCTPSYFEGLNINHETPLDNLINFLCIKDA